MLASRPGGYRHRPVIGAQSENNATPPADARSDNRYGDERDNRPTYETRTWNTGVQTEERLDTGSRYRPSSAAASSDVRVEYCYKCGSPDHLASFHNPSTGSGRGQLQPALKPAVKNTGNAGGARVNRCAVICDESASQKPVAAARSTSDDLPGYRIIHDAETLDLMQE